MFTVSFMEKVQSLHKIFLDTQRQRDQLGDLRAGIRDIKKITEYENVKLVDRSQDIVQ
jgi:hypothetical protein